ncbi:MAG: hypothetical protein K2R98_17405 [Gemmataceae bacterium]|nr:hypothetical protein [Gemmataceae bacterium]
MPTKTPSKSPSRMVDRLISAGVAIVLGLLVWLYARSRDQEMIDNVPVPVQLVLAPAQADQYDLEITGPAQVVASFTGPPSRMRELRGLIQRGELRVQASFTVPHDRINESRYLDTVRIDASDVHPPPGVKPIVAEGRNRIPVTLRRIVERRLPVRVDCGLEERVSQMTPEPATVLVRGPQEILDRTRAVPTQPYLVQMRPDASSLSEVVQTASVPLLQELEGRPIRTNPRAVAIRLTLKARQKVYELVDVPVQFLCPPNFMLRPEWRTERDGKVTLRLLGPSGADQPNVTVFIDLTTRKFEAGLYEEPLRLQLPPEFQLAQNPPRAATFRLSPLTGEGTGLGGGRNP